VTAYVILNVVAPIVILLAIIVMILRLDSRIHRLASPVGPGSVIPEPSAEQVAGANGIGAMLRTLLGAGMTREEAVRFVQAMAAEAVRSQKRP